jgi:fibronectin type 3 domain-containing protein
MDGSTPVNLLGYNVYRISKSQPDSELKPLNAEPVTATRYEDKRFKFGETYTYFVRAVSLGTEARPVESLSSNEIKVLQEDKYPPAAPDLTTPNPAPGRIALFWTANSEADVVGYYLYRSTDPNLAKEKWQNLTPQPYTRTTFTDQNVETGKTYYYYVVAIDSAGNTSPPSAVVSETVP